MRRFLSFSMCLLASLSLFLLIGCAPQDSDQSGSDAAASGDATQTDADQTDEGQADSGDTDSDQADAGDGDQAGTSDAEPAKQPEAPAKMTPGTTDAVSAPADKASDSPVGQGTDEKGTDEKGKDSQPTDETVEITAPDAPEDGASETVKAGDPSLTAGIPGEGPVTVEQIKKWLANPNVLKPLNVELPLGLAGGRPVLPADNPITRAKIELGRQLYFDKRLSADNTVSCASCHDPAEGYARHTQFGEGIDGQKGGRNSPVSYNRILSGAQFWDGRAASLEEQAVGPIANPIEMGNTHEKATATVKSIEGYRLEFDAVFPGEGVTIDNIGKALATFERVIVTGSSPYDYYEPLRVFEERFADDLEDLDGLKEDDPELFEQYQGLKKASAAHPISESARRGRVLFFGDKGGCTACHASANFSDELYHNIGVGMDAAEPDLGRFAVTKQEKDKGAFKTPTVRNVTLSAPYMHDGSQKTLEEVVAWYDKGGHANATLSERIKKLNLTDQDQKDLVEFMKALEGPFPKVAIDRLPAK